MKIRVNRSLNGYHRVCEPADDVWWEHDDWYADIVQYTPKGPWFVLIRTIPGETTKEGPFTFREALTRVVMGIRG